MVTVQDQANKKVLMQEELLMKVHSKQAQEEERMEKLRRIKESQNEEIGQAKQKAIDMLLATQNELLSVFANVKVSKYKWVVSVKTRKF